MVSKSCTWEHSEGKTLDLRTTSTSIENLRQTQSFGFYAICARHENQDFTGRCYCSIRLRETSQRGCVERTGEPDVLSFAHGILARAGARAAADGENSGVGEA